MTVPRVLVVAGLLAVAGFAARAQEPEPQQTVRVAGCSVVSAIRHSNVVPATFRAQLVVDNRFSPKVAQPKNDDDRDPRDRTGKIHCLVCEHGLSPMVAVFVRDTVAIDKLQATDGLSKLIKGADALVQEPRNRADKLAAFTMFLKLEGKKKPILLDKPLVKIPSDLGTYRSCGTPERSEQEKKEEEEKKKNLNDKEVMVDREYPHDDMRDAKVLEVKNYADVVKVGNVPFGLHPEKSDSITAFMIGDAPVTVIIYNRLRIVRRWELKLDDLTDGQVLEILDATEEMIRGKKVEP